MRFSWQVYKGGLPFPPPVDHILSELSAMIHPSWVALHDMAHSFIELFKPICQDKAVNHERKLKIQCQHSLSYRESKGISEKHIPLFLQYA